MCNIVDLKRLYPAGIWFHAAQVKGAGLLLSASYETHVALFLQVLCSVCCEMKR